MRSSVILVCSNIFLEKAIIDSCISKQNINILETVSDSVNLMEEIPRLKPRVIIVTDEVDESPLEIIIKLMETNPIPVLLILSKEHEIDPKLTYALEYGIVDVIDIEINESKLIFPQVIPIRINILAKLKVNKFLGQIEQVNKIKSGILRPKLKSRKHIPKRKLENDPPIRRIQSIIGKKISSNSIIVIAASTGGPQMIVNLISQFPRKFPPVIVIQHMPEGFLGPFADRIDTYANMKAKLAQEGDEIHPNHVYVAPGGRHLEVEHTKGGRNVIHITDSEKVNFVRPAADVTLKSVAKIYRKNTFAVILTGMGADGRDGCKYVKEFGGRVITLNEEDSVIFGMNQSVIKAGYSDLTTSLNQIGYYLVKWIYTD